MVNGRKSPLTSSPNRLAADPVPSLKRPGDIAMTQAPEIKVVRHVLALEQAMPLTSDVGITVTGMPTIESASIRSVVRSLENYRLRLPLHLPVADGHGIRRFKGREFVDVARARSCRSGRMRPRVSTGRRFQSSRLRRGRRWSWIPGRCCGEPNRCRFRERSITS